MHSVRRRAPAVCPVGGVREEFDEKSSTVSDTPKGRAMSDSVRLRLSSMRNRCSDAEWQARIDLAACYRLVELYGMSDMMANHISARIAGEDDAFLINAYGMLYEEITASSLLISISWWIHRRARRAADEVLPSYRLAVEALGVCLVALTGHLGGFLTGVNT